MSWSVEETLRFIELYRMEESIWNPKSILHKDKNKVNDSWKRLADAMGIPMAELKKKKESLMTTFRTHLKKKKVTTGMGADGVYKPTWVFYEPLESFLCGVYECKSKFNTEEDVTVNVNDHEDEENSQFSGGSEQMVEGRNEEQFSEETSIEQEPTEPSPQFQTPSVIKLPQRTRRSKNPAELKDVQAKMDTAFTTLNQVLQKKKEPCDDECDLYGRLLAKKLRGFNTNNREELMYEIDGMILKKRREVINPGNPGLYVNTVASNNYSMPNSSSYNPSSHSSSSSQDMNYQNMYTHDILQLACVSSQVPSSNERDCEEL